MDKSTFFKASAITVRGRRREQYFYGDSISGYFESRTFTPESETGYLIRNRSIYRDFCARAGRNVLNRDKAQAAVLYPYGIEHRYAGGAREMFSLLCGRRALAMTVETGRQQALSIYPLIDIDPSRVSVSISRDVTVLSDEKSGEHIAFSSPVPFTYEGMQKHERFLKPKFRAADLCGSFTLYAVIAGSRREAVEEARALSRRDVLEEHRDHLYDILTRSTLQTDDSDYNRAVVWSKLASYFMVVEEFGKGIWAGLPWFRDNWGRDTFIALPGTLLVTGLFDEARDAIRNFFRYQNTDPASKDYGRVPNRVASATDIIYNTTDGTPWLVREVYEYLCYTGDLDFVDEVYPSVKLALDGPVNHYVDKDGFLTHEDADTWMDAKIEGRLPWSARGNRANDIQALWFTALQAGARLAELKGDKASAAAWSSLADRLSASFPALFWDAGKRRLADRVDASGRPDYKVRPNQLMVISVPLIDPLLTEKQGKAVVRNAVSELLYPYGIASLSQNDPYFHPYHHNDDWYHFDAAYHNGTVWGWNAGFTTTAMCRHGQQDLAWKLARNLTAQILNEGCLGAMSELIEAMPKKDGSLTLSGTWAQAWSSSEFVRNAYQDFCGFRPRLLEGRIELAPAIPAGWTSFTAVFPFGRGGRLHIAYKRVRGRVTFILASTGCDRPLEVAMNITVFDRCYRLSCEVHPDEPCALTIEKNRGAAIVEKNRKACSLGRGRKAEPVKPLSFAKPSLKARPASLREKHYLQTIIEKGAYV